MKAEKTLKNLNHSMFPYFIDGKKAEIIGKKRKKSGKTFVDISYVLRESSTSALSHMSTSSFQKKVFSPLTIILN